MFHANDRCQQENVLAQQNAVRALHAPLDNLLGNNACMLITSLASDGGATQSGIVRGNSVVTHVRCNRVARLERNVRNAVSSG